MEFGDILATFGWMAAAITLAVIEANTVQLVSIWFAAGCLAAMVPAILGLSFAAQFGVVTVVSLLTLAITRPLVRKKLVVQKTATNVRALIGEVGRVIAPIDNSLGTGRILIHDADWSARSAGGEVIGEGEEVRVLKIEGVKLIVEKV